VDSDLDLLDRLLVEGHTFTFDNFSIQTPSGRAGRYGGNDAPQWLAWKTRTANTIRRFSAEGSAPHTLTKRALAVRTEGNGVEKFEQARETLLSALEMTRSAVRGDAYGELRTPPGKSASPALSNRVFVVHGHDSGLKTDVERFLREIGLEPVVLHREPDQGATIIEKFEKHSDVGYAVVLLTPDELAFTADQKDVKDSERVMEFRARPNVIFELGYSLAAWGERGFAACVEAR
jgi:hypothetical protein